MWRLRCVTFSSTSRLIPLFNLFSSRTVCVSRHPPLLTSISPPPISQLTLMLSPLFRRARERIPTTLPSSVSLSFFLFSCTFSLAQCLLLVPCSSVFVRCSFNVSLTLFLSRSFSLLIGILSFSCHLLCSIHYPSSFSTPLLSILQRQFLAALLFRLRIRDLLVCITGWLTRTEN